MKEISITIKKTSVYEEVSKTTSYIAKNDESTYEKVFTSDADRLMLETFWVSTCDEITQVVKEYIKEVSTQKVTSKVDLSSNYTLTLSMPSNFDTNLRSSIETSIYSYFINSISSRWLTMTKGENVASSYVQQALGQLKEIKALIYYRAKPKRVSI
ncbi:hypothetical protein [Porphyromonas sp. COT-108 OH1349]|uniref:hypothetical protein n=1 Tax=Porphyromonas sp. COT-108 OH1349 TaxID=1537504 RepID=UPI00052D436E|nr:hypothetical protein [Porphyromonas sp. COT-108 OH1349]KGN69309.1 hypothetical protein JT26_05915 [Porphyromonas sp. COT-108 OH1349]